MEKPGSNKKKKRTKKTESRLLGKVENQNEKKVKSDGGENENREADSNVLRTKGGDKG